jgi:Family of unknown function (DUF6328)
MAQTPVEPALTDQLDQKLIEFLNELRVALPGVQVLFAFLLAVPFASGWERVTRFQRDVFFIAFLCTAAATMLLIAPSAYHRLRWKDDDLKGLLEIANRLTIAGISFLALGMTAVVLLITDLLFSSGPAIVVTGVVALGFGWFWYGLALRGRARG